MKNYNIKKLILVACFALFALSIQAQIQVSKVGFSVSQWNRTYSDDDERFFFITPPAEQGDYTSSGIMPSLFIEVGLFKGVALEGRIGTWSRTYTDITSFRNDLSIKESIKQRIIPASFTLLYNYGITEKLNVFAGLGVNRYFIQHTVDRVVTNGEGTLPAVDFTGNNYGMNYKFGVDYYFTERLGLGIEGRYNTGSYNKKYVPEFDGSSVTRNIELQGLEVGLSIRFRLSKTEEE